MCQLHAQARLSTPLIPSQILRLQIILEIVLAFVVHVHLPGLAFTVAG